MLLDDLIEKLQKIREEKGNIPVAMFQTGLVGYSQFTVKTADRDYYTVVVIKGETQ
jgi:hypothetical protein